MIGCSQPAFSGIILKPVLTSEQIFVGGLPLTDPLGWVRLESSSDIAPIFLHFTPELTSMDGAEIGSTTPSSQILTELDGRGLTRVYLDDPNFGSVQTTVALIDGNGTQRASASRSVPSFGALVETAASLFPGVTANLSDYIRVISNNILRSLLSEFRF